MKITYPIVPVGSVPTCFSCSGPTDPDSEEESGFSVGRGARQVSCPRCGKTTYFDFAPEVSPANEAHVVAFEDGTFLGPSRTRVKTVGEDDGLKNVDRGRDQAAREAEAGL